MMEQLEWQVTMMHTAIDNLPHWGPDQLPQPPLVLPPCQPDPASAPATLMGRVASQPPTSPPPCQLKFVHQASSELINGQGYFYFSFYPQYLTHECYTASCSSSLHMQLPILQSRDNNIHPIICSKLVFEDQIWRQNWRVEMKNGNELQMLCITHLCSPHSFLHVLSTLYILDNMLIHMEPFFAAPTDKLTVSPPLAMKWPLPRA